MFLRRSSPSSSIAWGKRHLGGGAVQWELGDGEADEAETHEDGGENADEEGTVVATSDALVQPLAVVVEDVNTSEGNYKYCGLQSSTTTRKSLGLQFLKSIKSIICSTTDHNFVCLKRGASQNVLRNTDGADTAGLRNEAFWSLGNKVFFYRKHFNFCSLSPTKYQLFGVRHNLLTTELTFSLSDNHIHSQHFPSHHDISTIILSILISGDIWSWPS